MRRFGGWWSLAISASWFMRPKARLCREAAWPASATWFRASIAERYRDFNDYRARYLAAARQLVDKRYLLTEELPRLEKAVERNRQVFANL